MKDLIERQAAIDAIRASTSKYTGFMEMEMYTDDDAVEAIESLPSVQPELPFKIQDILDYLDTTLHPIISPEHWNVYSELHDMISTLSSAQPERKPGRWIRNDNGTYSCSVCQSWIPEEQHYYARYCLYCGADMRGEMT